MSDLLNGKRIWFDGELGIVQDTDTLKLYYLKGNKIDYDLPYRFMFTIVSNNNMIQVNKIINTSNIK